VPGCFTRERIAFWIFRRDSFGASPEGSGRDGRPGSARSRYRRARPPVGCGIVSARRRESNHVEIVHAVEFRLRPGRAPRASAEDRPEGVPRRRLTEARSKAILPHLGPEESYADIPQPSAPDCRRRADVVELLRALLVQAGLRSSGPDLPDGRSAEGQDPVVRRVGPRPLHAEMPGLLFHAKLAGSHEAGGADTVSCSGHVSGTEFATGLPGTPGSCRSPGFSGVSSRPWRAGGKGPAGGRQPEGEDQPSGAPGTTEGRVIEPAEPFTRTRVRK